MHELYYYLVQGESHSWPGKASGKMSKNFFGKIFGNKTQFEMFQKVYTMSEWSDCVMNLIYANVYCIDRTEIEIQNAI